MGTNKSKGPKDIFKVLSFGPLNGLAGELQDYRDFSFSSKGNGIYRGSILGFVKGLRFSSKLIYFLRERLSGTGLEVNWGHILSPEKHFFSPECDIIIHEAGVFSRWNGTQQPVMDFVFVLVEKVKAVISCKSFLRSIDKVYPQTLKKIRINKTYLFAECCNKKAYAGLLRKAKEAGYKGLWCLYFVTKPGSFETDEGQYEDFMATISKEIPKKK